jgi:hypothetical protein
MRWLGSRWALQRQEDPEKQQASAFTEAFLRALSGRVLSPETTSQIVNTQ